MLLVITGIITIIAIIFIILFFTKSCEKKKCKKTKCKKGSIQESPKQESPKQESPCPEQSKYKDLDCTIYGKEISEISIKDTQKCSKIESKSDCIKNNFCDWGSLGEKMEMGNQTSEEIKNQYGEDVYEKSCMLGVDGLDEIMWKHALCTKDSNSNKKIDLNEFKNDLDGQKVIDLITKIFNEVKGSDNKMNRCQYKKFNKKILNETTEIMKNCKKLNKNFDNTSLKCIDKPEEGK